jgi:hypothetical protein
MYTHTKRSIKQLSVGEGHFDDGKLVRACNFTLNDVIPLLRDGTLYAEIATLASGMR